VFCCVITGSARQGTESVGHGALSLTAHYVSVNQRTLRLSLKLFPRCWKIPGFCRDSHNRKWLAGSVEAVEPDQLPVPTYFPLRNYTAGKVPACATFYPLWPHWRRTCVLPAAPVGPGHQRALLSTLGLDRECYRDNVQGNFMDFTVNSTSSLRAPFYRAACQEQQQSRLCRHWGWDGSCTGSGEGGCTSSFSSSPCHLSAGAATWQ